MDRTMIAPWKAEEKEQSEKLHKKLQGLAMLYPMNDEMLKLLSWDMFLKSNQPAFFQVMYYLFRILDPAEFKRRFYWPITDKKSEANFRSSTVDYLKHLNEKHQLQWSNIKSYLVVMPGGMKFINFLLDLVGFVVQELTKQREKALPVDADIANFHEQTVMGMMRQNQFMKEYYSAYIEELNETTCKLRQCTNEIRKMFADIAVKTGVDETLLRSDAFLKNFEAYNRRKCENNVIEPAERCSRLEAAQCELKEAIDGFLDKQTKRKQNREVADQTLRSFNKLMGVDTAGTNAGDRINALLSAFNRISETIAEQLNADDHYNESNEIVTTDLQALREQLLQLEQKGNDMLKVLKLRSEERNNLNNENVSTLQTSTLPVPSTPLRPNLSNQVAGTLTKPLLMRLVSTPPIKPDMTSSARNVNVRLPLHDDFNAMQFEATYTSLMVPPVSARKAKPQQDHNCTELNSTAYRSKIVDSTQLLRKINKASMPKTAAQANVSTLGSKWKQMEASFDEVPITPAKSHPINNYSPFTPLNCNERTFIEWVPQPQLPTIDSTNNSQLKSQAVLKVLDASLNVLNLSTSPSGRLDALVPGPLAEPQQVMPRILLNDYTLNDSQQSLQSSSRKTDEIQPVKRGLDLDLDELGEEDLLNISDSVLNDILP